VPPAEPNIPLQMGVGPTRRNQPPALGANPPASPEDTMRRPLLLTCRNLIFYYKRFRSLQPTTALLAANNL